MSVATKTKPQVATMNAVHDLPVLVARDRGFFRDEGLDIEAPSATIFRPRRPSQFASTARFMMPHSHIR